MTQLFETAVGPTAIAGYARVAPEQGIDSAPCGLTYSVPCDLEDLRIGQRVSVPLGRHNRRVSGYVVERSATCDVAADLVKPILSRDPRGLALPGDLIELARWMANYYCCPLGMVFVTMLPAAVKRGARGVVHTKVFLAEAAGSECAVPKGLTKLQRAVLEAARAADGGAEGGLDMRELADRSGARSIAPVRLLIRKGLLATRQTVAASAAHATDQVDNPSQDISLTPAQNTAVERVVGRLDRGFSVHLLHGVTGSGKTEVYLRVIEQAAGGSDECGAIVLVPEIALTPQTVGRFVGRFRHVAVLHSGLTDSQRHEQWRRIHDGDARIVVGARSAVFAPMKRVGIIIVDEEHEGSYKQDQLPRYHARDVAIKRAQLLQVPVVLGSATPSLESYYNTTGQDRYHLLSLPERVAGLKLPKVDIVDMRQERRLRHATTAKRGVHLVSTRLETLMRDAFVHDGQVMLLLNRRGYANYIACPDHRCGWLMNCQYCDAMMVYHKDRSLPVGGFVRCHHCGAEQRLPQRCPQCGDHKTSVFGLGTQRVEEELQRTFPSARVARMDSDTMRTARDYEQCLGRFRERQIDVLLGTQMIAKGLDFPNVHVVGVISADTALNLPDFRASERTFQLIAQVAGRAGRGSRPGRVVVQSFSPEDPAIVLASRHDYEAFAKREIELRCGVGLPPAARMARLVIRYRELEQCRDHAQRLAEALTAFNLELGGAVRVLGPSTCPIARIAGYHRQQIELIAPPPDAASTLQKLMTALRNARLLHSDAHTAVDVDPVAMM